MNELSSGQRQRLVILVGLLVVTAIASSVITAIIVNGGRGSLVVTATLPPTEHIVFVTGDGIRATLPPSWTPTFTHTPPPPTLTPSLTFTPSITPTYTIEDICAAFSIEHTILDGQPFNADQSLNYIINTGLYDIGLLLRITNLDTEEQIELLYPSTYALLTVPISELPGPGHYRWEISAFSSEYQESCTQSGEFRVTGSFPTVGANPPTLDPAGLTATTPTATATVASATPTATFNANQQALADMICETFTFLYALGDGFTFLPGDRIAFTVSVDAPDAIIRWTAVNTTTGERVQRDYPGAGVVTNESILVTDLPGTGTYEYRAYLFNPQLGNFCWATGTFRIAAETRTPIPSFTPTRTPAR